MTISFRKKSEKLILPSLSGPQVSALTVLGSGGLKKHAAEAAGVHPQAVSEWVKQPQFRKALDTLRGDLIEQASKELRSLTADSLCVLRDALRGGHPALRLKASTYVLDRLLALPTRPDEDMVLDAGSPEEVNHVLRSLGVGI